MRAVGLILAGGNSHKMRDLTRKRAVAAMPMAGSYRAVDFTLSNMSNSHIQKVAVLTQYNARSLNEHLNSSKWWDFGRKHGGLYVFTPTITADNGNWYRGTADAIYQNLDFLRKCHEPYVIIASGDAVYKMDYNKMLEYHIAKKADMLNILTALRSGSPEFAAKNFVDGGKLSRKRLEKLFGDDRERAARSFADTPYHDFVKVCFSAIEKGLPFTEAERLYESIETIELSKKKYELKNSEPFLYYVFRRHAEIANVRILFVCLLSGMDESGIKNRLRAI